MDEEFTVFELRSWDDYIKLESKMNWRTTDITIELVSSCGSTKKKDD